MSVQGAAAKLNQLAKGKQVLAKADVAPNTGALVLKIDTVLAEKLEVPGGERSDELHVTLAFFDNIPARRRPALQTALETFARTARPLKGELSGYGVFTGESNVLYLSADIPGLPEFRQAIVQAAAAAGVKHNQEHGYTPHMTLKYYGKNETITHPPLKKHPLTFSEFEMWIGRDRRPYQLGRR